MRRIYHVLCFVCLMCFGCGSGEPTLILSYTPETASVSVDGYSPANHRSPHRFTFYSAGQYRLKVSAPGYKTVEMLVTIKDGETLTQQVDLLPIDDSHGAETILPDDTGDSQIAMPPVPVSDTNAPDTYLLDISSAPPGANVTIRTPGSATGSNVGRTPLEIPLPQQGPTLVRVEKEGYSPVERMVIAPESGNRVQMAITLARQKTAVSLPRVTPSVDPGPLIQTPVLEPDPPSDEPGIDDGNWGYISISSVPSASIYLDGKPMGNTPVSLLRVPVGTHKILLENRDEGKRSLKTVKVRPNEHLRLAEQL